MNNLKKIVAILSIGSMAAMAFPAGALTAEELAASIATLQAQLNQLMAQYQQLTGSTPSTVACTFTRALTIGVSGDDVKCLQDYLIAGGYSIPAGATAYFGEQTRSAVAAWQAANGVAPTAGYFGPISQAKYNSLGGTTTPTPGEPTVPGEVTTGEEGDFEQKLLADPIGVDVYAGDKDISVAAFELKAKDSSIRLQRVDLNILSSVSEARPWKVFNRIGLKVDGNVVVTKAISSSSDFTKNSEGNYNVRLSGISELLPVDQKVRVEVIVSVKDPLDSKSVGSWEVKLVEARGTDGAGLSQVSGSTGSRTFDVSDDEVGKLEVELNEANLEERVVFVSDSSMTKDVELLAFDVKAKDAAVKLTDVTATLATLTGSINIVAPTLKLYRGTTLIDSISTVTTGKTEDVIFDDFDEIDIAKNSTVTMYIKADINKLIGATYSAGEKVKVTLNAISYETVTTEEEGEAKTLNLGGNYAHLYEVAPVITYQSASLVRRSGDYGNFGDGEIKFTVKAQGGAIYISNSIAAASESFIISSSNADVTPTLVNVDVASSSGVVDMGDNVWKINSGATATVTVNVTTETTTAQSARVFIQKVKWGENNDAISTEWTNTAFKAVDNLKTGITSFNPKSGS